MESSSDNVAWRAPDGVMLSAQVRPALTPRTRGTALLLHAMMVDARTFDRPVADGLAATLQRAGWRVVLADFRGRCGSGRPVSEGGAWSYDDLVRYDVPTFVRGARALDAAGPLVIVGHSLGGHVAAASLIGAHARVDALAMLAANVWLRGAEPSSARRGLKIATSAALWLMGTAAGRLPGRALGIGPVDEAAAYTRDLARYCLSDAWTSHDGAENWVSEATRVRVPVSQWHASGDRFLASHAGAASWSWPLGAAQYLVGGGGCGVDFDPSHMALVTDARCRPAWQALARWLERVT